MSEKNNYPISEEERSQMLKLGITKDHLDEMLKKYPLDDVVEYVKGSLKPGDYGDDAAGPRSILQG